MSRTAEKKTAKTPSKKETRAKHQARVVHDILEKVESHLSKSVDKASLGDYLKLLQLEKELEAEDPPELKVTWVEPPDATKSESGE